jgi:hypothetical protein
MGSMEVANEWEMSGNEWERGVGMGGLPKRKGSGNGWERGVGTVGGCRGEGTGGAGMSGNEAWER